MILILHRIIVSQPQNENGTQDKQIILQRLQTSAWASNASTVHLWSLVSTACRNAVVLVLELPAEVAHQLSGQVT